MIGGDATDVFRSANISLFCQDSTEFLWQISLRSVVVEAARIQVVAWYQDEVLGIFCTWFGSLRKSMVKNPCFGSPLPQQESISYYCK